jgi:hypothetical protein
MDVSIKINFSGIHLKIAIMKKITPLFLLSFFFLVNTTIAQTITINIDANATRKTISPYIYGKNNNLSDDPGNPTKAADWKLMREAGLRFTREYGGNNGTKYNWRLKLSSHPDWYNNVYAHNWDYAAKTLQDSMPPTQGMWGFQLIGKAASTTAANFDDYKYNGSAWWSGVNQNLAGGGTPNTAGGNKAQTEGNSNLYLMNWNADSTTALLDHWFGSKGLGYDKNKLRYWTMDNEPEIWSGTHDDIMPTQLSAEAFLQSYFAIAKKARMSYPDIKLAGPVPATEWQWYSWNNAKITANGKSYVWLEYFIKRVAEEQAASGLRLLDVIDIHSYPNETKDEDILQLHRIYFDTAYVYPGANGVKTTSATGWDNSITKEFVFERCNRWLKQYMGANHGVTFAVSEYGFTNNNANVTATSYASVLGTFADHNVEYFTPWYWHIGMWEVLHLYSHYAKTISVQGISSEEQTVSAYTSINNTADSMTIVLVNRSLTATRNVKVTLSNFAVANGTYSDKQLKQLPATETFVSHASNALQVGSVTVASNSFTVDLPALSTTAVLLKGKGSSTSIQTLVSNGIPVIIYPNPVRDQEHAFIRLTSQHPGDMKVEVYNAIGQVVYTKVYEGNVQVIDVPCGDLPKGVYMINAVSAAKETWVARLVKL